MFGVLIMLFGAGIMIVIGIQGDKIADSIEAGRGVDTVYVADSLVYKLVIEMPDSLCKAVRIIPKGKED
jgi:hypothetical protein